MITRIFKLSVPIFIAIFFSACSTQGVQQTTTTIELGSEIDISTLFSCKENFSIHQSSDENFDTTNIGTYDVLFTITNPKGNTTDNTFQFTIVDTISPELQVDKDNITIIFGTTFDINDYAKATDNSDDINITYSPEIDTRTIGDFEILVTATDFSENATSKTIYLNIIERENLSFRNTIWGDSLEFIKNIETAEFIEDIPPFTVYSGVTIAGKDAEVFYTTDPDYGLYIGMYNFTKTYVTGASYIQDFYTLKEAMIDVYGEPDEIYEPYILSSFAHYFDDYGQALTSGYVEYIDRWEIEETNTRITLVLGTDNYVTYLQLVYGDTHFTPDNTSGL